MTLRKPGSLRFVFQGLAVALCLLPGVSGAGEPFCDQSGSNITASPDGQWAAHVQEEVCTTATGAAAGITVVLVNADDPAQRKRVFIMPVPRSRDDWPRVHWQGPAALEVRVPNLSEASPPEPEFAGIRVSLAYCGDNPGDRARLAAYRGAVKQWQVDVSAWAARRKADAAAAGPRPARPEEPSLPRGRCID